MTKAEFHRDLTAMTHQLLGDGQTGSDPERQTSEMDLGGGR